MKIYSKEEFAYAVGGITGFTDEVGGQLLSKALVGAQTPKYVNVRLGIKGSQALNLLDSNASVMFQSGACSLTPTGTTTYTQRNLVTQHETYFEQLCYKDLWDTYQSMLMKPGQTNEDVPFEQAIADLKIKQIQQRVESKLWTASTGGTDSFNGFSNLIVTGATSVANSSGTTFSSSAAYGVSGNPITFRLYVQALTRANFFVNYIGGAKAIGGPDSYEAIHPNSNVKVVPTLGLSGSGKVVIGPAEYMAVGFDLVSDHQKLDMWYSKDFDAVRLRANFNYGAQIAVFSGTNYFATNNVA